MARPARTARIVFAALAALALAASGAGGAHAQESIKVGVIGSFTGPYAGWKEHFQNGLDLYLSQNEQRLKGARIELIYRDTGGNNPARAKQLAQELVTRDGAQYLVGGDFTPTSLAIAQVSDQAMVPFINFNSTSIVTTKSRYTVRMSASPLTIMYPLGRWARDNGIKTAVTLVADFAPGHDTAAAVHSAFESAGTKILLDIRVPLDTTDFSSYMQRIQELRPDGVFLFMPAGPLSVAAIRSFAERGLSAAGVKLLAGAETDEEELPAMRRCGARHHHRAELRLPSRHAAE